MAMGKRTKKAEKLENLNLSPGKHAQNTDRPMPKAQTRRKQRTFMPNRKEATRHTGKGTKSVSRGEKGGRTLEEEEKPAPRARMLR